ncbi:MAG: signal recognition particle subunit SRP19/SEC65 family protein [Aeropyrum sp.]|nr:signal recognition particle subunit SRP19/SEC65 family protein [Aeropyrum sp.]MCE4615793.1 signal recognition particle subunit SRP19/SEC65 family protein [Aeropyrum sp.]
MRKRGESSSKTIVLWPAYFDSTIPRRLGRRVSKELSVPNPRARDVVEAARMAGFDAEVEEASYPRLWWRCRERVLVRVDEGLSKSEVLGVVARRLKEIVASRKR